MGTRQVNPMKKLAMDLAHIMDDEKRLYEMNDWDRQATKQYGNELRMEIIKKGYDIHTIMHYVEEYKTMSMAKWMEWKYI